MNIIVIPDVHTNFEKVERIIKKYRKDNKFVFVGDYFDQYNDTPEENYFTAKWLKDTLDDPNRVYLFGNHDLPYIPWAKFICSGFTLKKKEVINEVLTIDDWNKLKFFHFENRMYFSHAGLTEQWFVNPINNKLTIDYIQKQINDSVEKLKMGYLVNAIWASDKFRGGNDKKGGILWNDWRNADLIENVRQVFGHTPLQRISSISDNTNKTEIINVDCSKSGTYMSEVLQISDTGQTNVLDTSYV